MCGGLIAAPGQIEVTHLCRAQYAERVHPLRAEVHTPLVRGGTDEEEALLRDERDEPFSERGEELGHGCQWAAKIISRPMRVVV